MYGRNTEHTLYSLTPKLAAKATQRIRKARSQLLTVPRRNNETSLSGLLLEIPQPNHRVQPKTQSSGTFRAFGFVHLRLLTAEKLFGIFECIFYLPAVCVAGQYFGRVHRYIGGGKEVVFFFAIRVSTDNQQYRLGIVGVFGPRIGKRKDAGYGSGQQEGMDITSGNFLKALMSLHALQVEKVSIVLCEVPDHKTADMHLLRIDPACGCKMPQGWVARTGGGEWATEKLLGALPPTRWKSHIPQLEDWFVLPVSFG